MSLPSALLATMAYVVPATTKVGVAKNTGLIAVPGMTRGGIATTGIATTGIDSEARTVPVGTPAATVRISTITSAPSRPPEAMG
jgi:hypothetical protein